MASAPTIMPMLFMLMASAGSQKAWCACKIAMVKPLTLKISGVSIIRRIMSTISCCWSGGRSAQRKVVTSCGAKSATSAPKSAAAPADRVMTALASRQACSASCSRMRA